jgi:putative endonuclease
MEASYVYIMASRSRTLYTGVTANLERRVAEHKNHLVPGFSSRYRIDRLVYFETWGQIRGAIEREKQIKAWLAPVKESCSHRIAEPNVGRPGRGLVWKSRFLARPAGSE